MNTIYEIPPILQGNAEKQLQQLRDYLVRIVRQLPTEKQVEQAVTQAAQKRIVTGGAESGSWQTPSGDEQLLKALIIKTADTIYQTIDVLETTLHSEYVAQSEFGEYKESVNTTITQTAKSIIESYNFQSQINGINDSLGSITQINGMIRRGFLPDPDHVGSEIFGIVIAQNIKTTGQTQESAGFVYDELDTQQMDAYGFYTATGWQFWKGANKVGWFDSQDSSLHVSRIVVESELKVGVWLLTGSDGFGIRYMG